MTPLRPLSFGEILDVAFKLYFRHWAKFTAVVAIVVVPLQVVEGLIRSSTIAFVSSGSVFYTDRAARDGGQIAIFVLGVGAGLIVTGLAFRAISEAYMGRSPSIGASLGFALRRTFALLWLGFLLIGGIALGLILLVIPGIYVWMLWAVAVPSLLVEDRRGAGALGRSRELVTGRWWNVFGLQLIGAVVVPAVVGLVLGLLALVVVSGTSSIGVFVVVTGAVSAVAQLVTLPITVAVTTVMYFDLRVRKEGLDVALMMDALSLPRVDGEPIGFAGLPASPPLGGYLPPPGMGYPPPPGYGPPPPPGYPPPGYGPPPPPGHPPPGYGPPPPPPSGPPQFAPPAPPVPPAPPAGPPPPGTAPPGWATPQAPDVPSAQDTEPGTG